jgi:hypothetical protein
MGKLLDELLFKNIYNSKECIVIFNILHVN